MYPVDSRIDATFLARWMPSREFTDLASGHQGRTVLPKINQAALSQLPVPVPRDDEQHEIVRRSHAALAKLDAVAAAVEATRAQLDAIERAVLAKAFRELVAQDAADGTRGGDARAAADVAGAADARTKRGRRAAKA